MANESVAAPVIQTGAGLKTLYPFKGGAGKTERAFLTQVKEERDPA